MPWRSSSSSEKRADLLRELGCEHVIDRRAEDYKFWKDDTEQDIRGMSIKLKDVPGVNLTPGSTEQDFVLFSHPVMLASTAPDFLELLRANEAGGLKRVTYFATHPRAAAIGAAAEAHHTCHVDIPYFSATPYRFGPGKAVKYELKPTSPRRSQKPNT